MSQHPSPAAGQSQSAAILECLRQHAGEWVPMPLLVRVSNAFAVHSRISDLRSAGHVIEHRNLRYGRAVHSFYRLAELAADS